MNKWLKRLSRKNFRPSKGSSKYSRICSIHFKANDFVEKSQVKSSQVKSSLLARSRGELITMEKNIKQKRKDYRQNLIKELPKRFVRVRGLRKGFLFLGVGFLLSNNSRSG